MTVADEPRALGLTSTSQRLKLMSEQPVAMEPRSSVPERGPKAWSTDRSHARPILCVRGSR